MKKSLPIVIAIILLLVILVVIILLKNKKIGDDYNFEIYFFQAGKADAILIQNEGKYMMIDTGEQSLSQTILNYFESQNIKKLDYLVITHFDKDHVGSASAIINNIEVGEVIQSNVPKDSIYYDNYISALNENSITPTTASGDLVRTLGDVSMTINGPTTVYEKNESNNSSLIVSLTKGEKKFLFMGDSQNQRLKDFIANNQEEYDFLKVPYHGRDLKQLDNLLEGRNIKYAVITSSNLEKEADETVTTLEKHDIKIYKTREGAIRVYSNGSDIIIKQ